LENKLTFTSDDFHRFLLSKLIEIETDLILQKHANQSLFLHLDPEGIDKLKILNEEVLKHRQVIKEAVLEVYQARLAGLSVELDNYLATLLNQ
jgi:hypothetical protein